MVTLSGVALAQPTVPPAAIAQFNQTIGQRVEAVTVLGGDQGAMGGIYTFRGGNFADLSVTKIGGRGELASPRPLGWGNLRWSPEGQINYGHVIAENEFRTGYLQGNRTEYDVVALQAGGGARFYLNDHLSFAPGLAGIYSHTENEFKPQNPVGEAVKAAASGTYVDWELDSWSVMPSLDGRYEWSWGRTRLEFSSRYSFFHTESYNSSSPVIQLDGNSHTWENKLDADVPLGWELFGGAWHTGGFFSRTELGGNVADGVDENHLYTVNGRFVLDLTGKVWGLRWLGLGYSYFWADNFNGWSAGLDIRLEF